MIVRTIKAVIPLSLLVTIAMISTAEHSDPLIPANASDRISDDLDVKRISGRSTPHVSANFSFTLYGDASDGWGFSKVEITNPGPRLVLDQRSLVNITIYSNDSLTHNWFIDYDGNLQPGPGEPSSPDVQGALPTTFAFVADRIGNFTYRCAYHPLSMAGTVEVRPAGLPPSNRPPMAAFSLSPTIGNLSTRFMTDASASSDAEDPTLALEVRWDWEDDGVWDTDWSVVKIAEHMYPSAGTYSIRLVVRDSAGLSNETLGFVIVDGMPPITMAILDGTTGENGWYRSPLTVSLGAADDMSGVSTTWYRVDGESWRWYTLPFTLGDGIHILEFYSVDRAGNAEEPTLISVRVDATAPVISGLTPTGIVTSSQVVVTWTGLDTGSGISGYAVSVNGGQFEPVGAQTQATFLLPDGDHVVRIRAIDTAGNFAEAEIRFRVDTNVFSVTGPYRGIPSFLLAATGLVLVLFWHRRKRGTHGTNQRDRSRTGDDRS